MYSQNKEEEAIVNHFGAYKGTFLDLGANDGKTLSNTRALAELGWCGVLVEPSPTAFSKLKRIYETEKKGCFYVYNCAIGNHNGSGVLHDSGTLLKTGDTSLVSTMVAEEKTRFEKVLSYQDVEVKVFRWKTFLNRLSIKKFDCISLDIEGMDIDVLKQMDLDALGVKLLVIEWNSVESKRRQILEYTSKFGMDNVIYTSGENLILCRR